MFSHHENLYQAAHHPSMDPREHHLDHHLDHHVDHHLEPVQSYQEAPQVAVAAVKPSRVLFFRNLPKTVTEEDLVQLVTPFSHEFNPRVYVQAARGQGFAEFSDQESSTDCLRHFTTTQVTLKGNTIYACYSTRDSVTTHEQHISRTENASPVLLVHVVNLLYPVTIDMLHHIFSRYGIVERIVTFQKEPTVFQAFVQFHSVEHATGALRGLDNQNIYTGCNLLRIQYSSFQMLTVRYNNNRSRDYTNPDLPQGPDSPSVDMHGQYGYESGRAGAHAHDVYSQYPPMGGPMALPRPGGYVDQSGGSLVHTDMQMGVQGAADNCILICYRLVPGKVTVDELFNLFSFYGHVVRIKIMHLKPENALIQYAEPAFASLALEHLNGARIHGQEIMLHYAKAKEITLPQTPVGNEGTQGFGIPQTPSGSTQPPTPEGEPCMPHQDNCRYKQYSLKDRRYGSSNMNDKIFKSACRPTQLLHVANIPLPCNEQDLEGIFQQFGIVNSVRFLPPVQNEFRTSTPSTKMALVAMDSIDSAVHALMGLHNYLLGDRKIKVSFSKAGNGGGA